MPSKMTAADTAAFRDALLAEGWKTPDVRGDTAYLAHVRVQKTPAGFVVGWAGMAPLATYTLIEPAVMHAAFLWEEVCTWLAAAARSIGVYITVRDDHFLMVPRDDERGRIIALSRRVRVRFSADGGELTVARRVFRAAGNMNDADARRAALATMRTLLGEWLPS